MESCAREGVHLCDLTGESMWVRDMIDKHHAQAERTGAKIVPSCGFDSIPAVSHDLVREELVRVVSALQVSTLLLCTPRTAHNRHNGVRTDEGKGKGGLWLYIAVLIVVFARGSSLPVMHAHKEAISWSVIYA